MLGHHNRCPNSRPAVFLPPFVWPPALEKFVSYGRLAGAKCAAWSLYFRFLLALGRRGRLFGGLTPGREIAIANGLEVIAHALDAGQIHAGEHLAILLLVEVRLAAGPHALLQNFFNHVGPVSAA